MERTSEGVIVGHAGGSVSPRRAFCMRTAHTVRWPDCLELSDGSVSFALEAGTGLLSQRCPCVLRSWLVSSSGVNVRLGHRRRQWHGDWYCQSSHALERSEASRELFSALIVVTVLSRRGWGGVGAFLGGGRLAATRSYLPVARRQAGLGALMERGSTNPGKHALHMKHPTTTLSIDSNNTTHQTRL